MHKKTQFHYINKFLKNIFVRSLHLKLLSLFIAFGLWFAVTSSEKADAVKKVPLNFITAPGLAVSADTPSYVDIKVTGPRIFVREILERKEYIKIDIRDQKEGLFTYKFYAGIMDLPIGVKIDDFYPSGINIKLEKLKTKKVKVVASLVGQPINGYRIDGVTVEPSSVEVSASEGVLSKTDVIYTQVIDVSNLNKPERVDVSLDQSYASSFKSVSVEKFTAYIDVKPIVIEKRFNGIKVDVVGQDKFSIKPQKVDVTVSGSKEAIEKLNLKSIRAYIDISFNAPGKHSEQIKVKLPDGVSVSEVNPKKVEVSVYRGD